MFVLDPGPVIHILSQAVENTTLYQACISAKDTAFGKARLTAYSEVAPRRQD